jgi:23S rRNA (pseudouridine1915-N3)-methyltransferase
MKLLILAVGRPKDKNISLLSDMYIGRSVPKGLAEVEFATAAKDGDSEKEGASVLKKLRERDTVVLLDEHGTMYDSAGFSRFISESLAEAGGRLVFVIGGAFGLSEEVKRRADAVLSLSKMTMPHELCLLFLSEQLYRAFSIIAGSDYHHV